MILTPEGEVLTNAHVVEGSASITVTLNDESEGRPADLIGANRAADVALLRIRDATPHGRAQVLRVGDGATSDRHDHVARLQAGLLGRRPVDHLADDRPSPFSEAEVLTPRKAPAGVPLPEPERPARRSSITGLTLSMASAARRRGRGALAAGSRLPLGPRQPRHPLTPGARRACRA